MTALSTRLILTGILLASGNFIAKAQVTDTASVKKSLSTAAKYSEVNGSEKLYLHFDKPYYAVGDTAWFKAYVLKGDANEQSAKSAKLYVELLAEDLSLVKRWTLPVFDGLAQGYLPLDEKLVADGTYTVRAYTNWLQNFGEGYFFHKQFTVGKIGGRSWLLTEQHQPGTGADTGKIKLSMRFNNGKGLPLVQKKVSIKILEGTKTILKSEPVTDVQGMVNSSLSLSSKARTNALSILVDDPDDKSQRIKFPFYPSGGAGDIDLQFLPEGGNLIADLYSKVAFKAVGEDGLGRDIKGVVTDSKGEEVAQLQSTAKGLGSFMMVPKTGETYTAKINLNGKERSYLLPAAKAQGLALRVDGINHAGELYIYLSSAVPDDKKYLLVVRSRDKVYMGSGFSLNAEGYFNTRISKSLFPTGLLNLTVIGSDNRPVAQRSVFIDHHDALKISTATAKTAYAPHDSITLDISALNHNGTPAQGSFSVSVTDDTQVKENALADNIQSHLLLTSDLKGNIEDPAWYFNAGDEKLKERTLDNLLLTQGWQGVDWNKASQPVTEPLFTAESDVNSVSGSLKNLFNKPAAGLKVSLLSKGKELFFQDTVSDAAGKFSFKGLPLTDTISYLIKLHNAKNKSTAAAINMDIFKPTRLPIPAQLRTVPWNVNADTTLIGYLNKIRQRNSADDLFIPANATQLKQVSVKATRNIQQVNGEFAVEIDAIDEKKLFEANKMSLMDLLEKELKGTLKQTNVYALLLAGDKDGRMVIRPTKQFVLGTLRINDFVVDGQSLGESSLSLKDPNTIDPMPFTDQKTTKYGVETNDADSEFFARAKDLLNQLSADDVKKISVFRGRFLSILITTRSGAGISASSSIGTYAYRPLPMQLPKQFYRPKYNVTNTTPDMRSTIHWEPNLITDDKGKGKIGFYAADGPATYTVTIEGTDMQGHFGVSRQKIVIAVKGN